MGPVGRSAPKMTAHGAGNLGSTAKNSGGESDESRVRPSGQDDERLAMLAALVSGDRWRVCQSDYEPIECTK